MIVGDLNVYAVAIYGDNPSYRYQPSKIVSNSTLPETFYLTIQNTGDGVAKNFKIDMVWEPDTGWINFKNASITNSAYASNCPEKSNVCSFDALTKQIGAIKLQYSAQINWTKYQEIRNENPQIQFNYNYNGMPGSKSIIVTVLIPNQN